MNNIKDKLALMAPSLVFGEGEPLTVTVPAGQFRDVAKSLRDDPQMRFDLLLCMTGMDWGETLGVVYHLRSTELGHEIVLRTETADRENPELQSVYDLWESANLNEREVYDFFGIRFIGHPDMRRLYLFAAAPGKFDVSAAAQVAHLGLDDHGGTCGLVLAGIENDVDLAVLLDRLSRFQII